MDYRGWKIRRNRGIKILIVAALFTWTTREGIQAYYLITDPYPQKVEASKEEKPIGSVPGSAIEAGDVFVTHWYHSGDKETKEAKLKRLEPFISPAVKVDLESKDLLKMGNTSLNNVQPLGEPEWIQPGQEAKISFRVSLEDSRTFWVSVRVIKAGQRWVADSLPGLIPEPRMQAAGPKSVELDQATMREVSSALDGFFPMWLAGKEESYRRFAIGKIPTANSLKMLVGAYQSVEMVAVSEKPLQVRAIVKVINNKETHYFEYLVTFKEQNGQLRISDIQ